MHTHVCRYTNINTYVYNHLFPFTNNTPKRTIMYMHYIFFPEKSLFTQNTELILYKNEYCWAKKSKGCYPVVKVCCGRPWAWFSFNLQTFKRFNTFKTFMTSRTFNLKFKVLTNSQSSMISWLTWIQVHYGNQDFCDISNVQLYQNS